MFKKIMLDHGLSASLAIAVSILSLVNQHHVITDGRRFEIGITILIRTQNLTAVISIDVNNPRSQVVELLHAVLGKTFVDFSFPWMFERHGDITTHENNWI